MCVLDKVDFNKIPGELYDEFKINPEFRNIIIKGIIKTFIFIAFWICIFEAITWCTSNLLKK